MNNWIDEFCAPLERLTGLPNTAFNSAEFAKFERDHILSKTWFCVANETQLPSDGWVHPAGILDLPLLVVREMPI